MSKKSPFIRFVINASGEQRQILKAKEKKGELYIFIPHAERVYTQYFEDIPIIEQRFTVHKSADAENPINLAKQTLELEGGNIIETAQILLGPKKNLINSLFSRLCPYPSYKTFDLHAKNQDIIKNLGYYNPEEKTLIYSVFVSSIKGPKKITGSSRFSQHTYDFENFRIYILLTYLEFTSSNRGNILHHMSSLPRINKENVPKLIRKAKTECMNSVEAKKMAIIDFSSLEDVAISFLPKNQYKIFPFLKALGLQSPVHSFWTAVVLWYADTHPR